MSAIQKQLYFYWKKLSERQSRKKFKTLLFKTDIERFKKYPDKKPAAQIAREMNALQKYWNCYPFQYYQFDLYRRDCTLSLEEMKKYVPKFFLNNLFFPLSFKDYGIVCEDKLLTYALLKAYEVPQPRLLFCYDHNTFYDGENNPISPTAIDNLIKHSKAEKLFVKARFGSEGKGIFVFQRNAAGSFENEAQVLFDHHFFTERPGALVSGRDATGYYIVQEGLVQHDCMNRI